MNRQIRPGVDRAIAPAAGVTRQGQPLSYNRAPAPDLAPWIGRFYVTVVDAPADHALQCGLLADTACIRVQLRGAWTAQTRDGLCALGRAALVFGPNTRRMAVGVTGSFTSVGAVLRPGAGHALARLPEADLAVAADVERFLKTTRERFGEIDILVNNAGGPPAGGLDALSEEQWQAGPERGLDRRHPAGDGGRLPPAPPDRSGDDAGRQFPARDHRPAAGDWNCVKRAPEHDPEKCVAVFRKDHAQSKT